MSKAYNADYSTEAWKSLRLEIIERDGGKCRNCGAYRNLEVHHWLPPDEHRQQVDERGYSAEGDPLIVHESGLVTLCETCHRLLTEAREGKHIAEPLYSDGLKTVGDKPTLEPRNIFEIWALNGKRVPFKVRRKHWNSSIEQYFIVDEVTIRKWPYGEAWGTYFRKGEPNEREKIKSAGTYSWEFYIDRYEEDAGEWWSGETLVAARGRPLPTLD